MFFFEVSQNQASVKEVIKTLGSDKLS